jgi:hypothetical protein
MTCDIHKIFEYCLLMISYMFSNWRKFIVCVCVCVSDFSGRPCFFIRESRRPWFFILNLCIFHNLPKNGKSILLYMYISMIQMSSAWFWRLISLNILTTGWQVCTVVCVCVVSAQHCECTINTYNSIISGLLVVWRALIHAQPVFNLQVKYVHSTVTP